MEPVQSRAIATRARLVEAAARQLIGGGMAGAGTLAVARAAGASQGALFRHFPTKTELLAETVAHLLTRLVEAFRAELGEVSPASPMELRIERAVASLWRIFQSAELRAVLEVYGVARTDAALEERLSPILARHRERIHCEARALVPELASFADAEFAVDAVVYAMQGAAVGLFGPALRNDAQNLAFFRRLAARELVALSA